MRSYSVKSLYLPVLYRTILLLSITSVKGFNPTTNGLYTNTSKTVLLCIDDFGAKGDGLTDDTQSFKYVWEAACSSSSRVKIDIPALKSYLVGPADFAGPCLSKVTLRLSGFIVAPSDPSLWEGLDVHKWLYFHGVKGLKVEGGGIINGNGKKWWDQSCKTNASNPCTHAPTALTFHRCLNLKVKNITFFNSQQKHLAFTHCRHVVASGVNIIAPEDSPNTDGIHISASTHVELKNIAIRTGDDCVSVVSNSSHIRMNNIFCGAGHGISIGSLGRNNSYALVEDVVVSGAVLVNNENGVRIKTWQGGSGYVRKITFENVWMQNVSNPIVINQYYCDSPISCTNQTSAVKIERVSFRGIRGTSATEDAIVLACSDSYPCRRLYLENIQLTAESGTVKSFCWEAYGTSSGVAYPKPCISSGNIIIRYLAKPNATTSYNYAPF